MSSIKTLAPLPFFIFDFDAYTTIPLASLLFRDHRSPHATMKGKKKEPTNPETVGKQSRSGAHRQKASFSDENQVKINSLVSLVAEIRRLVQSSRHAASSAINTLHVLTNFEIGRRIVEHEQKGATRAEYGAAVLKELSSRLTREFGKGFSRANLEYMRKFFLLWRDRAPAISQIESGKSPFALSWSHYVLFLTIKDADERSFYEVEAIQENWSLAELKRQVASSLYERLALSRKKKDVRRLALQGQTVTRPEDVLKEPYVLEFLGLDEKTGYTESDLEQAIIDRIEQFLLELGKGFLFESRQRRFTFDEDHYFVDLVFYNRLLRCYVLIDLKLDKLTHQDLGQMQMYVNWFDRKVKLPEENPTIGILLCKRKKDAIVELTLPPDANIHAREYKLYLPTKELLRQKLIEWTQKEENHKA
ncbi:PDDEXK nuclease domain-containing protein [Verrucomicrobium sp. BvORR106]|uniref:PDDEXK nuclease domain-containing protein n=1 Tax=Verrucomicrobium sp. BvORR106 TaxID=1403819 RepID=UPI002240E89D|nr:PDDEXK nuclease domain-containing protein [Verrucomicrobium sp. BvORR106]